MGTDRDVTGHVGRAFAWRSAVAFLAVGALAHLLVADTLDDHFERSLEFHAEFVTRAVLEPFLLGATTSGARASDAETLAATVAIDDQVTRIEMLGDDGRVVLADDADRLGEIGTRVAPADSHLTRLPVTADDATSIVVVQDRTSTDRAASALLRRFDVLLLLGLATTWALLLPLARRLGSSLRRRTEELEGQRQELRRLLGREQEANRRLSELAELKDAFLAAISHELRTPLTVVTGMLTTLRHRQDALRPEQRRELLERAEANAQQLDALLAGLLDLRRTETELGSAPQARLDLRDVVTEATVHLPPRQLEVRLDVTHVTGNRLQLERVLANLIGNAMRHAPGPEPIEVTSHRVADGVELIVADRGPGVPESLKQAVFEPFRQGTLRDPHAPGTGIGLSLVARFVAEHGGCVWVSDHPGGGARFHVRLPARGSVSSADDDRSPVCAAAQPGT